MTVSVADGSALAAAMLFPVLAAVTDIALNAEPRSTFGREMKAAYRQMTSGGVVEAQLAVSGVRAEAWMDDRYNSTDSGHDRRRALASALSTTWDVDRTAVVLGEVCNDENEGACRFALETSRRGLSSTPHRALEASTQVFVTVAVLLGDCPSAAADVDSDGACDARDVCPYDDSDDIDSDGLCAQSVCWDSLTEQSDHGGCATYAAGRTNEGFCRADGMCDACPCACANDDCSGTSAELDACPVDALNDIDSDSVCADVDSCPFDAANDADSDAVCGSTYCPVDAVDGYVAVAGAAPDSGTIPLGACATYATFRHNAGHCVADGVCTLCPCACGVECGSIDSCPRDAENDLDSDGVCGDVDSCPYDADNDADSDVLCAQTDTACSDDAMFATAHGACASYHPSRGNAGHCVEDLACTSCGCACAYECRVIDSCPWDAANDADSDLVCDNSGASDNGDGDDDVNGAGDTSARAEFVVVVAASTVATVVVVVVAITAGYCVCRKKAASQASYVQKKTTKHRQHDPYMARTAELQQEWALVERRSDGNNRPRQLNDGDGAPSVVLVDGGGAWSSEDDSSSRFSDSPTVAPPPSLRLLQQQHETERRAALSLTNAAATAAATASLRRERTAAAAKTTRGRAQVQPHHHHHDDDDDNNRRQRRVRRQQHRRRRRRKRAVAAAGTGRGGGRRDNTTAHRPQSPLPSTTRSLDEDYRYGGPYRGEDDDDDDDAGEMQGLAWDNAAGESWMRSGWSQ